MQTGESMKVLVTGAAGFLGQRLIRALLERGELHTGGQSRPIARITALDAAAPASDDARVRVVQGDLADREVLARACADGIDSVFHLAAVVSGAAEADYDLGMRVNVEGTRALLDTCRAQSAPPTFVFASSVAVFGGALPEVVQDDTIPAPQSSYGVQKLIGELLMGDCTRRGFIDGRAVRLPTIVVRPGKPNAAASSFASGIVREPLAGQEALLSGRARHAAVGDVAGAGGAQPDPCAQTCRSGVGPAARGQPAGADRVGARDARSAAAGGRRGRRAARALCARRAHRENRLRLARALRRRACARARVHRRYGHRIDRARLCAGSCAGLLP